MKNVNTLSISEKMYIALKYLYWEIGNNDIREYDLSLKFISYF